MDYIHQNQYSKPLHVCGIFLYVRVQDFTMTVENGKHKNSIACNSRWFSLEEALIGYHVSGLHFDTF